MKKRILSLALLGTVLWNGLALPVDAVTQETIKNSGDYHTGSSVYGKKLSAKQLNEVAAAVTKFVNENILPEMPNHQKLRIAAQYLASHCSYANSWAENGANTAWGALIYGEAQCSGYARGFKALCDGMGVPCYYVHAAEDSDNPSHQWNIVQLENGDWRHIDTQLISSSGLPFFGYFDTDEQYAQTGMTWDRSQFPKCTDSGKPLGACAYRVIPDTGTIRVGDTVRTLPAYTIDQTYYYSVRDIAAMMNGSENQFNIAWDAQQQALCFYTHTPYVANGTEFQENPAQASIGIDNWVKILIDNEEPDEMVVKLANYCIPLRINGKNYYEIRDLETMLGFHSKWDEQAKEVVIW